MDRILIRIILFDDFTSSYYLFQFIRVPLDSDMSNGNISFTLFIFLSRLRYVALEIRVMQNR